MLRLDNGERVLLGRLIATGFMLLFFGLALGTALAKTPTVDEPVHFLRGVVLGQTGELHLQFEHAPLSHRIIGALIATDGSLPDVHQLPSWELAERTQIARELVWESGLNVEKLFFLARLPIIWLGLLLGAMVASWTLSWLGRWAMVVAVVLFATSPNLLASSSLATTDLTAATFYFGTVYTWWRYLQYRSKRWWLMTTVLLGLALATKLTAVLLLPLLLLLALFYFREFRSIWRLLLVWLGLVPTALLVLWLVYGMEFTRLDGLSISIPAASYVRSWLNVLNHIQDGHQAFFLGELSTRGWPSYFPLTFLIKTPLVTLVLLLISLITILLNRNLWQTSATLSLPALTLIAAAMASGLNIGYRHILPALPFLLVLAAVSTLGLRQRWVTRLLLLMALGWSVYSSAVQYPHYLAYFNESAGGTDQGFLYLGDSNLDWGQDLRLLADQIDEQEGRWYVSYAGVGDPLYYDVTHESLLDSELGSTAFAAANPDPGIYAISANHLQGLLPDSDLFDWFRRRRPDANLGGSILIYDVAEQAKGVWIAHCLDPAPLLAAEESERLIAQTELRHLYFDCHQSLVLPGKGMPGWFVLPQKDNWWFREQMPENVISALQLVYRHDASQFGPSYDIYYWPGGQTVALLDSPLTEAEMASGQSITLPFQLGDELGLMGYQVNNNNWYMEWEINKALDEPLSLQAHLYTEESDGPIVGDSLGFSSEQWLPGDRLLQRFDFPGQTSFRYLETTAYNFSTLEPRGEVLRLHGK